MKKLLMLLLAAALVLSLSATAMAAAPLDGYTQPQDLEVIETIPSPFEFVDASRDPNGDGVVSSVDEWEARREEIKDLIQHYWYGYRWPTAAEDVSGDLTTVQEPNTITVGGMSWFGMTLGGMTVNLGDEFTKLVGKIQSDGVSVGETTYGPEADEAKATTLAIEAWNAGYSIHYKTTGYGASEGDAILVNYTGPITEDTIPQRTKPVHYYKVFVRNPDNGVTENFTINVNVPTDAQKIANWGSADVQVPFVIGIGGAVGAFNAQNLNAQGYGLVSFTTTTIYPDAEGGDGNVSRNGVYTRLYPYDPNEYEYSSGSQMAWGWAASQIITAMENQVNFDIVDPAASGVDPSDTRTFGEILGLDPTRTVVTGHSRNGQASMIAGAFDDRISITCPSEGANGSYRYKVEGKIFNFNVSYYPKADRVYGKTGPTSNAIGGTWLGGQADLFAFEGSERERLLPFDPGHLVALIAPRPYLFVNGIDQHWQGNEGIVAVVQTAAEVYDFIGANETEKNNIAVRLRQSDHSFYPQDFCFDLAIMDRDFGKPHSADGAVDFTDGKLHVQDLFPNGTNYSSMSYFAADYDNVSDMSSYPFDLSSYYMQWSSPNKYMLWTAQDCFLVNHDVSVVAHSDAPDVKLITPDGTTISASDHSGEEFTFKISADQAVYGRYELQTVGSGLENRSVFFSAISVADALRHGTTKGDEGEENRVLGFSSRLANDRNDPPIVLIDGEPLADGLNYTSDRTPKEEATLFGYGIQFHDKLFVRIANEGWDETKTFGVKNLKFVTMPEYTFEFSMADIYASAAAAPSWGGAGRPGTEGANRFTKAISWPVERYNNGPAEVWPPIPDTQAERQTILSGGTVTRPEAPAPWTTPFDTAIDDAWATQLESGDIQITLQFSESLNTGEYAFGFNAISDWETEWNEAGDELVITAPLDSVENVPTIHMIIFRLMDLDGNLIAGPIELDLDLEDIPSSVTVTFDANGGSCDVTTKHPNRHGNIVNLPVATQSPLVFAGWYTEDGAPVTSAYVFTEDTTVYAKYDNIPTTSNPTAPGTTAPTTPVTPGTPGTDPAPESEIPFVDVPVTSDLYDTVKYVYENGIMAGISDTLFDPNGSLTRGMVVSILYRLEGSPEVEYTGKFADVPEGEWFTNGVEWAAANGIVYGYEDGNYGAKDPLTREQLAAILYRYAEKKGYDTAAEDIEIADLDEISPYAVDAVKWAVNNGVLRLEEGKVRPTATAIRAEVAIAVEAFLEKVAK